MESAFSLVSTTSQNYPLPVESLVRERRLMPSPSLPLATPVREESTPVLVLRERQGKYSGLVAVSPALASSETTILYWTGGR